MLGKNSFRPEDLLCQPNRPGRIVGMPARAKLAAVFQIAAMNEAERSTYCREHGLYPEQLEAWNPPYS